ncbi:hypothetical protein CAPTEDRAFT_222368 [Capitella teleta]|uniref:Cation efflux protein transmembrane domain-containing protein n=1 Tax=Capitella teleta TaxID=283909 RepID=R7TZ33_CAPTE|nr:hypothetical protein CAPTEDRAFT_222368 [Capitella teleta]|eukprot:ELT99193.1 hypothetical protein CAPTEDRAFT_222368 [Capitella teleta]
MAALKELRMRNNASVDIPDLPGTIHPFSSNDKSKLSFFRRELSEVLAEKQGKKILTFCFLNISVTTILLLWCNSTNSMALTAFTYLTMFDLMYLMTVLMSIWVHKQKSSEVYSFGYERFEVLAVFSSTILAMLGSFFIIKESVERMFIQPDIRTGRLLVGTVVGLCWHLVITYSIENKAFTHVVAASSSSWLQEHVSDISQSICHAVPGLSKLLLPRINPFALIGFAASFALIVVHVLIDMNNHYATDTWAAIWISMMTCGTMYPMAIFCGKILLQTTPSHLIGQLDKCLREASTLDGVLEFRNEHFWTLGFGSMCGSVHVRVRRDADEQLVLAHVSNRLSSIITLLTVHIFKDDWTRPSTFQILGDTSLLPRKPSPQGLVTRPSPEGTPVPASASYRPTINYVRSDAIPTVPAYSRSSAPPPAVLSPSFSHANNPVAMETKRDQSNGSIR